MFPLRDNIPSRRKPVMVWALVGLNIVVFLFTLGLSPAGEALLDRKSTR